MKDYCGIVIFKTLAEEKGMYYIVYPLLINKIMVVFRFKEEEKKYACDYIRLIEIY